jgi:hypothetical protein
MSLATTAHPASSAKKTASVTLLGGAVVLLLLGVAGFDQARKTRSLAQRDAAEAVALQVQAHRREQLAQRNSSLLDVVAQVEKHAQASRVLPQHWNERRIDLRQQNLTREQVNTVLLSTARTGNQLLKLDEFDLAVTHPDDGLFGTSAAVRYPVMVSLRGTLNFRISDQTP